MHSALSHIGDLGSGQLAAALHKFFTERNALVVLVIDSLDEARGSDAPLTQASTLPWRIILTSAACQRDRCTGRRAAGKRAGLARTVSRRSRHLEPLGRYADRRTAGRSTLEFSTGSQHETEFPSGTGYLSIAASRSVPSVVRARRSTE